MKRRVTQVITTATGVTLLAPGIALALPPEQASASAPDVVWTSVEASAQTVDANMVAVPSVQGEFSYSQTVITPNSRIAQVFQKATNALCQASREMTEAAPEDWTISVSGDVDNAYRYLIATKLVDPPYDFGILPALPGCSSMKSPERMLEGLMRINGLIQEAAPGAHVLTCCAGRASSYLAAASMLLGMSVRVGMEDTPWMWPHKDELITSNAKMFQMFRDMAHMLGREIYTPEEYRQTMKIGRA